MKKIIIIMIVVLIAVYAGLSIAGRGGEYDAERLFYRAVKANSKIAINPEVAPPKLVAAVENDLRKVLNVYPKSNTAKTANIALAEFYIANKKYDEALVQIKKVTDIYKQDLAILSTAQFLKGITYERQNKWDKALKEYTLLRDKFPNTQLGIQAPLYIAKYYADNGRIADAENANKEAAAFYNKLEKEHSGKPLGYIAATLSIRAYLNMNDYEEAGRTVESTIDKYGAVQLLPYVKAIFVQKLNRPEKAVEIYKNVKAKARNKELIKALDREIEKLTSKKEIR